MSISTNPLLHFNPFLSTAALYLYLPAYSIIQLQIVYRNPLFRLLYLEFFLNSYHNKRDPEKERAPAGINANTVQ